MTKIYTIIHKINAWHIRTVALSLLVLCIGGGSQFLVNAFAESAQVQQESVQTTIGVVIDTTPVVVKASHHGHIVIHLAGKNSSGGYTVTRKK